MTSLILCNCSDDSLIGEHYKSMDKYRDKLHQLDKVFTKTYSLVKTHRGFISQNTEFDTNSISEEIKKLIIDIKLSLCCINNNKCSFDLINNNCIETPIKNSNNSKNNTKNTKNNAKNNKNTSSSSNNTDAPPVSNIKSVSNKTIINFFDIMLSMLKVKQLVLLLTLTINNDDDDNNDEE